MKSILGEITLIQIADLGKIKFMSLKVDGEKLIRFVGPNEAGKSTILDRIQNLFESASKVPDGLIRKGIYHEGRNAGKEIDRGMARVETSNGYVIEQVVRMTKDDKQKAELKVTHNGAPVQGGPLQFLQSVSTKYPDPHKVANLTEKELFKELFSLLNIDLSAYDKQIEDAKEEAKMARAKIKMLGAEKEKPNAEKPESLPENFESLIDSERNAAEMMHKKADEYRVLQDRFIKGNDLIKENVEEVDRLKIRLNELQSNSDSMARQIVAITEQMEELKPELEYSQEKHLKLSKQTQDYHKLKELDVAWKEFKKDNNARIECNQTIEESAAKVEKAQSEKTEKVLTTPVPAKNIYLTEDGGVLRAEGSGDLHWDTLSMAARLSAATELCINTIPEGALRALYIERGESIGTNFRKVIADTAAEAEVQVFMEVFSEEAMSGDGVFLLEEGEVIEAERKPDLVVTVNHEQKEEVVKVKSIPQKGDEEVDISAFGGEATEEPIKIGVPDEETLDLF